MWRMESNRNHLCKANWREIHRAPHGEHAISVGCMNRSWFGTECNQRRIGEAHARSRLAMPNKPAKQSKHLSHSRVAQPAAIKERLSKPIRLQATRRTHTRARSRSASGGGRASVCEASASALEAPHFDCTNTRWLGKLKQTRISPIAFARNAVFQPGTRRNWITAIHGSAPGRIVSVPILTGNY